MNPKANQDLMAVQDVMRVTCMSRAAVYRKLADGTLAARKAGRRTLIETASVRTYLDSLPAATFKAAA